MLVLTFALAAAVAAAPLLPDPAVAELTALEQQWGEAFVKRDFDFIERIVAPEYRLVVTHPDGSFAIIGRAEWMKNTRDWTHQGGVSRMATRLRLARLWLLGPGSGHKRLPLGQGGRAAGLVSLTVDEVAF